MAILTTLAVNILPLIHSFDQLISSNTKLLKNELSFHADSMSESKHANRSASNESTCLARLHGNTERKKANLKRYDYPRRSTAPRRVVSSFVSRLTRRVIPSGSPIDK